MVLSKQSLQAPGRFNRPRTLSIPHRMGNNNQRRPFANVSQHHRTILKNTSKLKIMKPKIEALQEFAENYFKNSNCPSLKWKAMKKTQGEADRENNIISINPKIPTNNCLGCVIIETLYKPNKKIKIDEGEQYFLVLLHEIAHFKIILKQPAKFIKLRKKLQKEFPNNLQAQIYASEDYLRKEDDINESEALEFRTFMAGDLIREHTKVEDWAIKEFEKRRKTIRKILNLPDLATKKTSN